MASLYLATPLGDNASPPAPSTLTSDSHGSMSASVPNHSRKNAVFMTTPWCVRHPVSHVPATPLTLRKLPVVGAMKSTMMWLGRSAVVLVWLGAME